MQVVDETRARRGRGAGRGRGGGPGCCCSRPPDPTARTPATAGPRAALPTSRSRRAGPTSCSCVMDDFSLDLAPDDAQRAGDARARGASYSALLRRRLPVLRLAREHLHRAVPAPDRRAHQHVRAPRPAGPLGGWSAFETLRQPRAAPFNVALQQAGYTTGFVGKYLNEYECSPRPAPSRRRRPAGTSSTSSSAPAYDGWDFGYDLTRQATAGSSGRRTTPAPSADVDASADKDRLRRQVIEDHAVELHQAARAPSEAPYFLEVAPYAPHNRTSAQRRTTPATRSSRRCSATGRTTAQPAATAAPWRAAG